MYDYEYSRLVTMKNYDTDMTTGTISYLTKKKKSSPS